MNLELLFFLLFFIIFFLIKQFQKQKVIPIIDLSKFNKYEINKLEKTLNNTGFFIIKNHGISKKLIDNIFEVSKKFFDLSEKEKLRVEMSVDYPYGYENSETLLKSYQKHLNLR